VREILAGRDRARERSILAEREFERERDPCRKRERERTILAEKDRARERESERLCTRLSRPTCW